MRITADRIEEKPTHSVTPAEVKHALAALPSDWVAGVRLVRLSSSMGSWDVASYSTVSSRLTLCSRGRKKEEVLRAMIRELYLKATLKHPKPEWRSSVREQQQLDRKLAPYYAVISNQGPNGSLQTMPLTRHG